MRESPYFEQAKQMLRLLPHIATERCFALKGGTAINFFIREASRLSVDIDLTYLPLESREMSLLKIGSALMRITTSIGQKMPHIRVHRSNASAPKRISKLIVYPGDGQIKIEPNEVLRGTVFPPEERSLPSKVEEIFELSITIQTLAPADLYGGKLCAALDRQHPRDLFDVKILLETGGISEDIRKAFIVYLCSGDRPVSELLDPVRRDFRTLFDTDFVGMATIPVRYEELFEAREILVSKVQTELTLNERRFLLSFKEGNPQWDLLGVQGIDKLPGIQWKLINIRRMNKPKHIQAIAKLRRILEL